MKQIKNTIQRLIKDESGQGSAEYILLIALVVAIVMMFGPKIKSAIEAKTNSIEGEMGKSF